MAQDIGENSLAGDTPLNNSKMFPPQTPPGQVFGLASRSQQSRGSRHKLTRLVNQAYNVSPFIGNQALSSSSEDILPSWHSSSQSLQHAGSHMSYERPQSAWTFDSPGRSRKKQKHSCEPVYGTPCPKRVSVEALLKPQSLSISPSPPAQSLPESSPTMRNRLRNLRGSSWYPYQDPNLTLVVDGSEDNSRKTVKMHPVMAAPSSQSERSAPEDDQAKTCPRSWLQSNPPMSCPLTRDTNDIRKFQPVFDGKESIINRGNVAARAKLPASYGVSRTDAFGQTPCQTSPGDSMLWDNDKKLFRTPSNKKMDSSYIPHASSGTPTKDSMVRFDDEKSLMALDSRGTCSKYNIRSGEDGDSQEQQTDVEYPKGERSNSQETHFDDGSLPNNCLRQRDNDLRKGHVGTGIRVSNINNAAQPKKFQDTPLTIPPNINLDFGIGCSADVADPFNTQPTHGSHLKRHNIHPLEEPRGQDEVYHSSGTREKQEMKSVSTCATFHTRPPSSPSRASLQTMESSNMFATSKASTVEDQEVEEHLQDMFSDSPRSAFPQQASESSRVDTTGKIDQFQEAQQHFEVAVSMYSDTIQSIEKEEIAGYFDIRPLTFLGCQTGAHQQPGVLSLAISKACNACRGKRCKCDKEKPSCGTCFKRNIECIYPPGRGIERKKENSPKPGESKRSAVSKSQSLPLPAVRPKQSTAQRQDPVTPSTSNVSRPIAQLSDSYAITIDDIDERIAEDPLFACAIADLEDALGQVQALPASTIFSLPPIPSAIPSIQDFVAQAGALRSHNETAMTGQTRLPSAYPTPQQTSFPVQNHFPSNLTNKVTTAFSYGQRQPTKYSFNGLCAPVHDPPVPFVALQSLEMRPSQISPPDPFVKAPNVDYGNKSSFNPRGIDYSVSMDDLNFQRPPRFAPAREWNDSGKTKRSLHNGAPTKHVTQTDEEYKINEHFICHEEFFHKVLPTLRAPRVPAHVFVKEALDRSTGVMEENQKERTKKWRLDNVFLTKDYRNGNHDPDFRHFVQTSHRAYRLDAQAKFEVLHGQEKVRKRKVTLETDPVAFHGNSLPQQVDTGYSSGKLIQHQQQIRQLGTENPSTGLLLSSANWMNRSMVDDQTALTDLLPNARSMFDAPSHEAVESTCPSDEFSKTLAQPQILAITAQPVGKLVDGYPPPVGSEVARLFNEFTSSDYEHVDATARAAILPPEPGLPFREAATGARTMLDTNYVSNEPTKATPQTMIAGPGLTPATLEFGNTPDSARTPTIATPEPMDIDTDPASIRDITDNTMTPKAMEEEIDLMAIPPDDEVALVGERENTMGDEVL